MVEEAAFVLAGGDKAANALSHLLWQKLVGGKNAEAAKHQDSLAGAFYIGQEFFAVACGIGVVEAAYLAVEKTAEINPPKIASTIVCSARLSNIKSVLKLNLTYSNNAIKAV